jgi:hypothetical protein
VGSPRLSLAALALAVAACGGGNEPRTARAAPQPPVTLAPTAQIALPAASPVRVAPGEAVAFTGICSAPGGEVIAYAWTFAGGSPASSADAAPEVVFSAAGTHAVTYACTAGGVSSNLVARDVVVTEPGAPPPPPAPAFSVTLRFLGDAPESQRAAFERARDRLSQVVTGDLPDAPLRQAAIASCGNVALDETVDDVLVLVQLEPIDGPDGILGQAGPCVLRRGALPALGMMHFDSADVAELEASGDLDAVVLHEMLHVLGFGTIWESRGLLTGATTPDPYFTGAGARSAFGENGGAGYPGTPVPVENDGGPGTRDGHWRESVLEHELMTGWISGATQPLSRTTIASLADLGYTVDLARADAFTMSSSAAVQALGDERTLDLGADARVGPVYEVDERGDVTPLAP